MKTNQPAPVSVPNSRHVLRAAAALPLLLVFAACDGSDVAFGERVSDGSAGSGGAGAGNAGAGGSSGGAVTGGNAGTGLATGGVSGNAGSSASAGKGGSAGSGTSGAAGVGGAGAAGSAGASGANAGAAGMAGSAGAAGSNAGASGAGGFLPTDPVGKHPWPMMHRTAGNDVQSPFPSGEAPPTLRWARRVSAAGGARATVAPLVDGSGRVYALTRTGAAVFDAKGDPVATIPLQDPRGLALTADGTVLTNDDAGIAAYALSDGSATRLWLVPVAREIGDWLDSGPIVAPDGSIYAVDAGSDLVRIDPSGASQWRFQLPGPRYTPTLGSDGRVYVGGPYGQAFEPIIPGGFHVLEPDGTWHQIKAEGGRTFLDASRGRVGLTRPGQGVWFFDLATPKVDDFTAKVTASFAGKPGFGLITGREGYGAYAMAGTDEGMIAFAHLPVGDSARYPLLNPNEPVLLSDMQGSPASAVGENKAYAPEVWGHPAGGLTKPGFFWWFRSATGAKPSVPSSPSLGPSGDIYFVDDDGLLYALDTDAARPERCVPTSAPPELVKKRVSTQANEWGGRTLAFGVGETAVLRVDIGEVEETSALPTLRFDGSPVPLRPDADQLHLRFDVPAIALPEGGRSVPIEVQYPDATHVLCVRVIPPPKAFGPKPVVTQTRTPGGGDPTMGQEIEIVGTDLFPTAPNELSVRVSYAGSAAFGHVPSGAGGFVDLAPLRDRELAPTLISANAIRVVLPSPEPAAGTDPSAIPQTLPLVIAVTSVHSNTGSTPFAFTARVAKAP